MDKFIEFTLRTLVSGHRELFGDESEYLGYEVDERRYPPSGAVTSDVLFARLIYQTREKVTFSKSLVLKRSSDDSPFRFVGALQFKNELFFYAKIAPFFQKYGNFDAMLPEFYGGRVEMKRHADSCVIVLENLQASGHRHPNVRAILDVQHAAVIMRTLGAFHAYSYRTRHEDAAAFYAHANALGDPLAHVAREWIDYLAETLRAAANVVRDDPLYSGRLSKVERIVDGLEGVLRRCLRIDRRDPTLVIRHGHVVGSHFLFVYDGGTPVSAKMFDWTGAALSSSSSDLAGFMYMALDQRMRDNHWDELFDAYYESLRDQFPQINVPTRVTIENGIRERSLYHGLLAMFYKPYVAALNARPKIVPKNVSPADIIEIGNSFDAAEKVAILKDMIDRNFIGE